MIKKEKGAPEKINKKKILVVWCPNFLSLFCAFLLFQSNGPNFTQTENGGGRDQTLDTTTYIKQPVSF